MTDYTLPENWHVLVTKENLKECFKWRFPDTSLDEHSSWLIPNKHLTGITKSKYISGVLLEKGHNNKKDIIGESYDFGVEITTDQFIEHVLKQPIVQKEQLLECLIPLFKKLNIIRIL